MKLKKVVMALSGVFVMMSTMSSQAATMPEGFPAKEATPDVQHIINGTEYEDAWDHLQNSWTNTPGKNISVADKKFVHDKILTASHRGQVITFKGDSHIIGSVIDGVQVSVHDSFAPPEPNLAIGNTVKGQKDQKGFLVLNYGAKAYDTVVEAHGSLSLRYDTEAYNTLVKKDGAQVLGARSYAQGNVIDGGIQDIKPDAIAEDNLIINGGQQLIYFDKGVAKNTHIGEGSYQLTSGLAEDTFIYDGGYQLVYKASGDMIGAKDTTIYNGGTQRIQYGEAHGTQVHGQQVVSSQYGDWEDGQWVAEDGTYSGAYPAAYDSTIHQGGTQTIEYYGGAYDTVVDGGTQQVNELGDIARTTITNGGATTLAYGAFSRSNLDVVSGSLTMEAGDLHWWTDLNNAGKKGAFAENVNLQGKDALLYLQHNADTDESIVTIGNLSNNGQVIFGHKDGRGAGQFSQLEVDHLNGTGMFVMSTELANGQGDFLNVKESIDGHFDVKVRDSGLEPKSEDPYHLISAKGSQKDHFSLVNGSVDLGAYKYYLNQSDANSDDWYLAPTYEEQKPDPDPDPIKPPVKPPVKPSEGANNALAMANVTPQIWDSELSTLRTRMGELRGGDTAQTGVWSKVISSRHRIAGQAPYTQDMNGVMIGGDRALDIEGGKLHLGALFSYGHSKLDAGNNSDGKVDSYALGIYATLLNDNGYYVDGVLKANHFKTENSARFNEGKTKAKDNTNGIGLSVEFGKHIKLDDYFVEPYALASVFHGDKTQYHFDSGMKVKADAAESIKAEVGATLGHSFVTDKGVIIKPYIRLAVSHEFKENSDVLVNNTARFSNDLSGTVGKYGVGFTAMMSQQWSAYGEFNYAKGNKKETPYSGSLGVRYQF